VGCYRIVIGYWIAWWAVRLTVVVALSGLVAKSPMMTFIVIQIPALCAIAAAFLIRKNCWRMPLKNKKKAPSANKVALAPEFYLQFICIFIQVFGNTKQGLRSCLNHLCSSRQGRLRHALRKIATHQSYAIIHPCYGLKRQIVNNLMTNETATINQESSTVRTPPPASTS